MALNLDKIDVEITNIQIKIGLGDKAMVRTIKKLDKQKQGQQRLVEKHRQLQAAKTNIKRFNKAS